MKAIIVTAEEVRMSSKRNYNPKEWDKNIDRMISEYKDVVFYYVPRCKILGYDRYFVEYTLPEGLRLFKDFSYGGGISSRGFKRLIKDKITEDGKTILDVFELIKENKNEEAMVLKEELENSKLIELSYGKFIDEDGNEYIYNTNAEARREMIMKSRELGMTFTKG